MKGFWSSMVKRLVREDPRLIFADCFLGAACVAASV